MREKKIKELERQLKEANQKAVQKELFLEELKYLYLKKLDKDVKAISKITVDNIHNIQCLFERVKKLEEELEQQEIDEEIDEAVDDMFT